MTREDVESKLKEYGKDCTMFYCDSYVIAPSVEVFYDYYMVLSNGSAIYYRQMSIEPTTYKPIDTSIVFGSDPEFFFVKGDKVVPSTQVLPKGKSNVKQDGFQGELNPVTSSCRQSAASYIATALERANEYAKNVGVELSFKLGHTIPEDVWKKAGHELKRFGCSPTMNVHEDKFKRVSGLRERFRAAGGHIHTGSIKPSERDDVPLIVKLMDIVAGNTCVLFDRDEDNARRRINYGRAGEYREKSYGLEYRVLSNFWLNGYVAWSLASGLIRNAIGIYRAGLADDLLKRFDMQKVRDAINNNDSKLAMENLLTYAEFLKDNKVIVNAGVDSRNIDKFVDWASQDNPLSVLGLDTTAKSLKNWSEYRSFGGDGLEVFLKKYKPKK